MSAASHLLLLPYEGAASRHDQDPHDGQGKKERPHAFQEGDVEVDGPRRAYTRSQNGDIDGDDPKFFAGHTVIFPSPNGSYKAEVSDDSEDGAGRSASCFLVCYIRLIEDVPLLLEQPCEFTLSLFGARILGKCPFHRLVGDAL